MHRLVIIGHVMSSLAVTLADTVDAPIFSPKRAKACKDVHKRVYTFLIAIEKVCISVFE